MDLKFALKMLVKNGNIDQMSIKNRNVCQNRNFGQTLIKNRNVGQNRNFGQNEKF